MEGTAAGMGQGVSGAGSLRLWGSVFYFKFFPLIRKDFFLFWLIEQMVPQGKAGKQDAGAYMEVFQGAIPP